MSARWLITHEYAACSTVTNAEQVSAVVWSLCTQPLARQMCARP